VSKTFSQVKSIIDLGEEVEGEPWPVCRQGFRFVVLEP
jgi:hypothetical protein